MSLTRLHDGYIFLVTVLVIGVIGAATATSLLLLGWAAEQNGQLVMQSNQAFEYAHTCAERVLQSLRNDLSYGGDETFSFSNGSCDVQVIGGAGNGKRMICTAGNSGDTTRRMQVVVDEIVPRVIVRSWEETDTFTLCP